VSVEAFCQRVQIGLGNATFEQKRQLVELLIDRVIVTNDQVEIRYVIPTSPSSEQVRFCHLRKDYFSDIAVHVDLSGPDQAEFHETTLHHREPAEAVQAKPIG
jgi:hypothetical protein